MQEQHRHKNRWIVSLLFVLTAAIVLVPIGLDIYNIHRESQNRILIAAIKRADATAALTALEHGADGDARDLGESQNPGETQNLSLYEQIRNLFRRKSQQEILQREHVPTALWLLFHDFSEEVPAYESPQDALWKPLDRSHVLEALLQHGARVNQDPDGTPLCWAARWGDLESMQVLFKHGADPNRGDAEGRPALFYALTSVPAIQLLLAHGANKDARDNEGNRVLQSFRRRHERGMDYVNENIVLFWIQNGTDVNAKDKKGDTLLTNPVCPISEPVLKALMARGADINAHGEWGITPLMRAASQDQEEAVRLLLKYGAEVNARDETGDTALLDATDDFGSVQVLLEHGADVNARDKDGHTALSIALMSGPKEMETLLKKYGAK